MATTDTPKIPDANLISLRDEWLNRLSRLVDTVAAWAEELGWSTRKIDKSMQDSQVGPYRVPGLVLQSQTDATKALLEPIARSAPGADGVVDLYLMPAYDDIATLYCYDGSWHLHYAFSAGTPPTESMRTAEAQSLSKDNLEKILEKMRENAAQAG